MNIVQGFLPRDFRFARRPRGGPVVLLRIPQHDLGGVADHLGIRIDRGRARYSRRRAELQYLANFWQNFVRFRLYRHRSLQVNMRFSAFFEINKII